MSTPAIFSRDDLDLIVAFAGCTLNESPGKNWVEGVGGLPEYICRIARAIKRSGKSTSTAVAIAVSRVKRWAAGGDDVDADTRAKAAKAVAEWEAKKARNKAKGAAKKVKSGGKGDSKKVEATHAGEILCLSAKSYSIDKVKAEFERATRKARSEWRTANPSADYDSGPPYFYIREMWSDYLIASSESYPRSDKLWKVNFSVDASDKVTFADPVEVKTEYVVVKNGELDGDDISDADLKKLMEMCGPCPVSPLQEIIELSLRGA